MKQVNNKKAINESILKQNNILKQIYLSEVRLHLPTVSKKKYIYISFLTFQKKKKLLVNMLIICNIVPARDVT